MPNAFLDKLWGNALIREQTFPDARFAINKVWFLGQSERGWPNSQPLHLIQFIIWKINQFCDGKATRGIMEEVLMDMKLAWFTTMGLYMFMYLYVFICTYVFITGPSWMSWKIIFIRTWLWYSNIHTQFYTQTQVSWKQSVCYILLQPENQNSETKWTSKFIKLHHIFFHFMTLSFRTRTMYHFKGFT